MHACNLHLISSLHAISTSQVHFHITRVDATTVRGQLRGKPVAATPIGLERSLSQKVDTLRAHLGLPAGQPLVETVDKAVQQLGLQDQVKGMTMAQKVAACLSGVDTADPLGVSNRAVRASNLPDDLPRPSMAFHGLPWPSTPLHDLPRVRGRRRG